MGRLSLELALLEGQRVQLTITSCQAAPFGSVTSGVCGFAFHALGSDVLARGPFTGSTFVYTVRGGKIVEVATNANLDQFASQMRTPFADWVSARYPGDLVVMNGRSIFRRAPRGFRHVYGHPTQESIRLWEQHPREYVKAVKQRTA
jgi:hypothetical protein